MLQPLTPKDTLFGASYAAEMLAKDQEIAALRAQVATLEEQVAAYTREQRLEMLKKFDEDAAKVQAEMNADRQMIRGDLTRLVSLQKELDQLQGEAGGKLTKNSIVGGISFIAGLLYLGNAVNEGLRLMFGDDGSVGNFAVNAGLALLGIGYYFFKKSQSDD